MEKHHYKLLILVFVMIAIAGVFFVKFSKVSKSPDSISVESTPVPVPVVEAQEPIITSVGSPDGKLTLTMREENSTEGPVYIFFTTDLEGSKNLLFTKTASVGAVLSIPENTFSPDNKYVFLKEEYAGTINYFIPLSSGIIDISALFMAKYPDFIVTDMTGWGGINLIVINTDKIGGGIGPSFWFEVPTMSFYRLSSRFN